MLSQLSARPPKSRSKPTCALSQNGYRAVDTVLKPNNDKPQNGYVIYFGGTVHSGQAPLATGLSGSLRVLPQGVPGR
eukprot:2052403-Amphidinium_carterae.1